MKSCSDLSARFFARKSSTDVRNAMPERIEKQSAMYAATPVARATIQIASCGSTLGSVREADRGEGRADDTGGERQPRPGRDRRGALTGAPGEEGTAGRGRGRRRR